VLPPLPQEPKITIGKKANTAIFLIILKFNVIEFYFRLK